MKQISRLSLGSASVLIALLLSIVAHAEVFPTEGPPGTTVTISGEGFGDFQNTQDNRVEFQGVPALIQSWEPDFILVKVPLKATSGPVVVMNGSEKTRSWNLYAASCEDHECGPIESRSRLVGDD